MSRNNLVPFKYHNIRFLWERYFHLNDAFPNNDILNKKDKECRKLQN